MQRHLKLLAGTAVLATISAGNAGAQTWNTWDQDPNHTFGPYIGVEGGGNFYNDVSPSGSGADRNSHYVGSYIGLGTIGYGLGNGFRGELELGYRHNNLGSVDGAPAGSQSGSLSMLTGMVNGIYDFDLSQYGVNTYGFSPHIGIGVGWARPRFNDSGPYNGQHLSGYDNLIAYQGIAGIDYTIMPSMPNIKLNLDYHYFGTFRGNFDVNPGIGGGTARMSFTDQEVLLGIRYDFNVPTPPPPPPPPPAPTPTPTAAPAPAPEAQRSFQVFFDFDKSDITDSAAPTIQKAADLAKQGQNIHIKVTGHTDTVGSAAYNQKLSERRADAVKQALINDGLSDDEIETVGVGKTDLLVPTPDGVREPQNRRATIEFQ